VYVTRPIPEESLRRLRASCEVQINPEDRPLTREELLSAVRGRDAVLTMLHDIVDAELIAAALPSCRIFSNYAVGFNNMDIPAATERGVFLTNTPDVLTDATADMTWALLFAVARRVVEGDLCTRSGRFKGWAPLFMLGLDVSGKTLGIVGAGRIGQAVAKRGAGFNMKIIYTAQSRKHDFERDTGAGFLDKDTLLREADFVSLHVPLTPSTHHLIGERELSLMKPSAILVNTSRGPVINEKALVKALKDKVIWGAGLDVYEQEPTLEHGLSELHNVVLCPHLGSSTRETRMKMGILASDNILAALSGEIPPTCLNPDAAVRRR
jgi:lactate dehydrogenase-like 2-hydroxyacid dehydrogenase